MSVLSLPPADVVARRALCDVYLDSLRQNPQLELLESAVSAVLGPHIMKSTADCFRTQASHMQRGVVWASIERSQLCDEHALVAWRVHDFLTNQPRVERPRVLDLKSEIELLLCVRASV